MKPKVLIIQEDLKNYRDTIYRLINEQYNLTVAYTFTTEISESTYNIIKLSYYKVGKFIIHKCIRSLLLEYDVVISLPHLKFVWLNHIFFVKRKFKLITWSIGVHVSYKRQYDLSKPPSFLDYIFEGIQDKADACIFYMDEPIAYWEKYKKIDKRKYFVAHNTVAIENFDNLPSYSSRDCFLFIGTLYKQKGLGELLEAYAVAKKTTPSLPSLKIIGKGPEEAVIKKIIEEKGLQDKVLMLGPIYDELKLKGMFFSAILCISPKQAGLSVLKSFGYGVPFVTRKDAITGGEKSNILNGNNGLIYESIDDLTSILLDSIMTPTKYELMSVNARNYYLNNASPQNMANGVINAIKYVLK